MNSTFRTHDIIGPAKPDSVFAEKADEQAALEDCLRFAPYAVVRRCQPRDGLVPLGVRGPQRHQRYAAWIKSEEVFLARRPEELRLMAGSYAFPALRALALLQERWAALPYTWGPTGSVGFALATGAPSVTLTSDLDILLRASHPMTKMHAVELFTDTLFLPARVDVQVETPVGSFALEEFAKPQGVVLLRTSVGSLLTETPWSSMVNA